MIHRPQNAPGIMQTPSANPSITCSESSTERLPNITTLVTFTKTPIAASVAISAGPVTPRPRRIERRITPAPVVAPVTKPKPKPAAATPAVLNSIAGGNDFIAAYPSNGINDEAQSIFYVLEDSPIREIKDIVGKTIAVNTLKKLLAEAMLDNAILKDVAAKKW